MPLISPGPGFPSTVRIGGHDDRLARCGDALPAAQGEVGRAGQGR